ncbi:hypothetical protein Tco_1000471 [Tanacetum coccineum]
MSAAKADPKSQMYLDELEIGVTVFMIVLVCRIWDVNATTRRYLSPDFVIGDAKVRPARIVKYAAEDEFHIFKNAPFVVEFDGETSVRKESMKFDGFIRYPFEFVELENLEVTNNKYMIDVIGGQAVRVTLWGGLREKLIEKEHAMSDSICPIIIGFALADRLYLSSSSSTLIIDDDSIPALKKMKTDESGVEIGKQPLPIDFSEAKAGTLEYLLIYRQELEVYDNTTAVVVVMFNEIATSLVKCLTNLILAAEDQLKAHTYYEHDTYKSFTCWRIVAPEELRVELEDSDAEASFIADTQSGTIDCDRGVRIGIVPYSPVGSGNLVAGPTVGANLTDSNIRKYSVLAKAFRMARDWCRSHTSVNVELKLLSNRTNARQYNGLTVSEVVALITNDFGDRIPTRDIIVNKQHTGPKRISELNPSYMGLQYPLLFPYGEYGFHNKIPYYSNSGARKINRGFMTMKEYYSYIIHHRKDQGTTLIKGGLLFQ